jgi:hypothetical protein
MYGFLQDYKPERERRLTRRPNARNRNLLKSFEVLRDVHPPHADMDSRSTFSRPGMLAMRVVVPSHGAAHKSLAPADEGKLHAAL